MSERVELVVRTVVIGVGATVVMDLWAIVLRRFGVRSLDFKLLGRWLGHLRHGRWQHASIAAAAPVPGERWVGWVAHYSIGVSFAALLLATFGLEWARTPSLPPALGIGVVTVAAPLLVLQPAFGLGVASRKTPTPLFNSTKSLLTHTVYGFGLYAAALAAAVVFPVSV